MFFNKRKDCNIVDQERKTIKRKKNKLYIFFFGSENGAAWVAGNIIIDNKTPYVICENGENKATTWEKVKSIAKNVSLSSFYWIKNINSQNYEDYTYTYDGEDQPRNEVLTELTKVLTFPITTTYSEAVIDLLYVNPKTSQPYIVHSVANGHGWHEPYFVSRCIKTTFEDIRELCKELGLNKYINIDENNWRQLINF